MRDPQVTHTLWITMNVTRCIILAVALAACGDDIAPYPTEVRRVPLADGRTAELVGAPVADVCEAIADAACDTHRCALEFYARCNPIGRGGLVEATTAELWDDLWGECLADAGKRVGYTGRAPLEGCARLTPGWP